MRVTKEMDPPQTTMATREMRVTKEMDPPQTHRTTQLHHLRQEITQSSSLESEQAPAQVRTDYKRLVRKIRSD